jgi:hypothetical protein
MSKFGHALIKKLLGQKIAFGGIHLQSFRLPEHVVYFSISRFLYFACSENSKSREKTTANLALEINVLSTKFRHARF